MVKAVNVKLVRDLARLVGQVVTIALVVACGIASYVTMQSAFDSLITSRDRYYEQYRFGDVFAHLERAPLSLEKRLEDVPGVAQAEARVVEAVMVPMPNMPRPASGTLVSLPPDGQPALDAVYLSKGRMLDPKRSDEVLLLTAFADAHHIVPGDRVPVVINGTLRDLRVVGLAMSPEFVFTLPPGAMTPSRSPCCGWCEMPPLRRFGWREPSTTSCYACSRGRRSGTCSSRWTECWSPTAASGRCRARSSPRTSC